MSSATEFRGLIKAQIKMIEEFKEQPQLFESRVMVMGGGLPKIPSLSESLGSIPVKGSEPSRRFFCKSKRFDPLDTDDFFIGVKDGLVGRDYSPAIDFINGSDL